MMTFLRMFSLVVLSFAFEAASPAWAQTYGRPTCPDLPVNINCRGVCTYNAATNTWTCDISTTGEHSAVIVADATASDYTAYGPYFLPGVGTVTWRCDINSTAGDPIEYIELLGTDYDDHLCFQDDGRGYGYSTNYLKNMGPNSDLLATMDGGNEDDRMIGSYEDSDDYTDELIGGYGTDTILGDLGDDKIYGDQYADHICGEGGDDYIEAGEHHDMVWGGDGEDTIDGGTDNDQIAGGADKDVIYGGSGNDDICGDAGDDELYGESGSDYIYGDGGTDTVDGGADYDRCDQAVCEYTGLTTCTVSTATCPY